VWGRQEAQRTTIGADVTLLRGSKVVGHLEPTQHFYQSSDEPVPTPSVHSTLARDVYVNLMAFQENGSSATLRVLVEPMVIWIWLGGLVVCVGAGIALWPRRRRATQPAAAQAAPIEKQRKRRKRPRHRRPVPAGVGAASEVSS
jgi:cytochrome c-type biogenesis protein CcmF